MKINESLQIGMSLAFGDVVRGSSLIISQLEQIRFNV